MIYEGLSRMRDLGAGTAFVTAVEGNEAAELHASAGFGVVNTEHLYGGKLQKGTKSRWPLTSRAAVAMLLRIVHYMHGD